MSILLKCVKIATKNLYKNTKTSPFEFFLLPLHRILSVIKK
jgi:hypothetical protein